MVAGISGRCKSMKASLRTTHACGRRQSGRQLEDEKALRIGTRVFFERVAEISQGD
jgi:hypothetical protein